MKRKILIVIYAILIIIALRLLYNYILNVLLIVQYNNGEYSEEYAEKLSSLNFYQDYVANYNYGNILYKNGEYDEAIEKYEMALSGDIPKKKECKIRINYALAICQTVEVDEDSQESINDAISDYEYAIEILTESGCANVEDSNGHSEDAEELKSDIQDEIDRLKELLDSQEETDSKEDEEEQEEEETDSIEEQINEMKEQAIQEERELVELYESFYKEYKSNLDGGKNW